MSEAPELLLHHHLKKLRVNAGVNWGHGAGVRRDHLLMPDTVLPVVPGVHWRDPRCFV